MTVDTSKIGPGDELTVRVIVRDVPGDYSDGKYVSVKAGAECFSFPCRFIVSHTPKTLCVGDHVWGLATKCNGVVRHVIDNLAWVEFEDGRHEIVLPDQVERHT